MGKTYPVCKGKVEVEGRSMEDEEALAALGALVAVAHPAIEYPELGESGINLSIQA